MEKGSLETNRVTLDRTEAAGRIMVPLDYPDADGARGLLRSLAGIPCYMKVGMQLFYAAGPGFVRELKEQGYKVFLDLKLHDIPNTIAGGAESITRLGVDMFNVHAAAGLRGLESAREGASRANPSAMPLIIAVTQLTSTSQAVMNAEIGVPGSVEACVLHYAALAQQAGLDGVVSSPLEVQAIKAAQGKSFLTVTPGIRPVWAETGDQSRVMTPREALAQGTDYMVIGRPISAAPNPREAMESIIEELTGQA